MSAGIALRFAFRDLFHNSWRLVPVNALLGVTLVAVGILAVSVHALVVLAVLAGPIATALLHCAVVVVRDEYVTLADARDGLRLHWRLGLQLGAAGVALATVGAVAFHFYTRFALGWPLAFLSLYLLLGLGLYVVMVATLAVGEPGRPLWLVAREAAAVGARRPGATLQLGLVLLAVNAIGIAAGAMPFLTLTVAYSFVAVAHFVLPRQDPEGS
ncbi:MAG TPA: hypothetical protein VFA56_09545 [Gaiellaceae bacterium]|nr:hypothetical protein [Gaiellaceae bacterium]